MAIIPKQAPLLIFKNIQNHTLPHPHPPTCGPISRLGDHCNIIKTYSVWERGCCSSNLCPPQPSQNIQTRPQPIMENRRRSTTQIHINFLNSKLPNKLFNKVTLLTNRQVSWQGYYFSLFLWTINSIFHKPFIKPLFTAAKTTSLNISTLGRLVQSKFKELHPFMITMLSPLL